MTDRPYSDQPYTLADLRREFPDDKACLEWLKGCLYPNGIYCEVCQCITKQHLVESRKSFVCQECGHHAHITVGTIYYRSSTPLTSWFYVIYRVVQTHGKLSAKQIEREIGVTYKTAWRMRKLITERLKNNPLLRTEDD